MTLHIPAHPDVDEGRKLFAHYLWNASVVVAEGVEQGSRKGTEDVGDWDHRWWDVRGQRVLELGAGT
jgi:predicted nicotinamide N-methyase